MKKTKKMFLLVTTILYGFSIAIALPKDSNFLVDGPNYIAEASGKGLSEAEAQNDALNNAILVVMDSLGKDRLFLELFKKNIPFTMTWKKLSSEKSISGWTVKLKLIIDDESLRLLYNTAYISTVSTLLDGAENRMMDGERLAKEARIAESDGQIARALSLYWQSQDACDAGLDLITSVGDAAIFSSQSKKKAPELREILVTLRNSAASGYERIQAMGKTLAADEELESAITALEKIEKEINEIEIWSSNLSSIIGSIEGMPKTELQAMSDELTIKKNILDDSRMALSRIEDSVPKSRELIKARIDVARRRTDSLSGYIKNSKKYIDTEIRDPAIARAKRSKALRWAFLHDPNGSLALRFYTPFAMDVLSKDIKFKKTGLFEFELNSEQAFGDYKGVWIASSFKKQDYPLYQLIPYTETLEGFTKSTAFSQSLDLGFFGKTMFGAGIEWDWLHLLEGETLERRLLIRAIFGTVDTKSKMASFLAVLSWEIPDETNDIFSGNLLNIGADITGRLAKAVELKAGASFRCREAIDGSFNELLMYYVGAGFRLPKPFLWGLELKGYQVNPVGQNTISNSDIFLRMIFEYSL